jgi:hypothetical protein
MSGLNTNTAISKGESQGFHAGRWPVNRDAARREFWGRASVVIACVLGVAVLALGSGGCGQSGEQEACRRVCAPRVVASVSYGCSGACICGGAAADGGAR